MGLVDYASDDSDSEPERGAQSGGSTGPLRQNKRKALPALPSAFASGTAPRDDPSLHQGRKRTRPFVEGDHDTHIYIALDVPARLKTVVEDIVEKARQLCPDTAIHSFLAMGTDGPGRLHISLNHPFPLRRSQIDAFRAGLSQRVSTLKVTRGSGSGGFTVSLAGGVKVYQNGRRYGGEGAGGRAFMALRVGAGAKEIGDLVDKVIHPILVSLHRPLYHENPEWHTSFAWWLLDQPASSEQGDGEAELVQKTPIADDVLSLLNDEFQTRILASQPDGGWHVSSIMLKIGKDLSTIDL